MCCSCTLLILTTSLQNLLTLLVAGSLGVIIVLAVFLPFYLVTRKRMDYANRIFLAVPKTAALSVYRSTRTQSADGQEVITKKILFSVPPSAQPLLTFVSLLQNETVVDVSEKSLWENVGFLMVLLAIFFAAMLVSFYAVTVNLELFTDQAGVSMKYAYEREAHLLTFMTAMCDYRNCANTAAYTLTINNLDGFVMQFSPPQAFILLSFLNVSFFLHLCACLVMSRDFVGQGILAPTEAYNIFQSSSSNVSVARYRLHSYRPSLFLFFSPEPSLAVQAHQRKRSLWRHFAAHFDVACRRQLCQHHVHGSLRSHHSLHQDH